MDDQRRSLIATAVVTLFILGLIVALVLFLVRFVQNRQKTQTGSNITVKVTPSPSAFPNSSVPGLPQSSSPINQGGNLNVNLYVGQGFSLKYPKNWGLLTCNNSQNFELDPVNGVDSLKFTCDRALKPVTVLVRTNPICQGDNVTLGSVQAVKSKLIDDNGVDYRWCTKTNPTLDITHRYSKTPSTATSLQDYSVQVEEVIKSITLDSGGS